MDTILSFLRALAQNNDRNWFLDHKPDYEEARRRFEDLALRFIEGVAAFDERCRG